MKFGLVAQLMFAAKEAYIKLSKAELVWPGNLLRRACVLRRLLAVPWHHISQAQAEGYQNAEHESTVRLKYRVISANVDISVADVGRKLNESQIRSARGYQSSSGTTSGSTLPRQLLLAATKRELTSRHHHHV